MVFHWFWVRCRTCLVKHNVCCTFNFIWYIIIAVLFFNYTPYVRHSSDPAYPLRNSTYAIIVALGKLYMIMFQLLYLLPNKSCFSNLDALIMVILVKSKGIDCQNLYHFKVGTSLVKHFNSGSFSQNNLNK